LILSQHYFCDLIHAISSMEDTASNFHLLALLYQALSYQADPGASDAKVI